MENQQIIVKKIPVHTGFHGGAWKVAYADFVTAMMAFFLLLWLLNVTTDEQKNAISNYFDPTHPKVSESQSGAGGVLGGLTMSPQGSMSSMQNPITPMQMNKQTKRGSEGKSAAEKAKEAAEKKRFDDTAEKIKKAVAESKELSALAKNLMIDMTPEGLRIQIVDQDQESMFPSGSAVMYKKMEDLLKSITGIIIPLPNHLSVRGHTDAIGYAKDATYTNWELSADRANASRRVIMGANFPLERLNNIMGKADVEPLIADNPQDARNRRITLILLKEELTNPPEAAPNTSEEELIEDEGASDTEESGEAPSGPPVGTFRRTPGQVEFP